MSTAHVTQLVPLLLVTELQRSLRFYLDGLGFSITMRWEPEGELRWCRLELDGAALMLQTLAPAQAMALAPLGTGVSLCFMCSDALAMYEVALERSLSPEEPFVGNGLWVVSLRDPDGYRVDFESPTDVPEETTLRQHRREPPRRP